MQGALQSDVLRIDAGVHVALAHPDPDVVAARHPLHVRAEEHVGQKRISVSAGIEFTTSTALPDVQQ